MKHHGSYPYDIVFQKNSDKKTAKLRKDIEFSSKGYDNQKKESYIAEDWWLKRFKIVLKPALKGTSQFKKILSAKENFKWVYTIYRELFIAPTHIKNQEISHALIAENKPVYAAGCGIWQKDILELNNYTGHYAVKAKSFRIHCQTAWNGTGVKFTLVERTFQ